MPMHLLTAQDAGFAALTAADTGVKLSAPGGRELAVVVVLKLGAELSVEPLREFQHFPGGQAPDGLFNFKHGAHDAGRLRDGSGVVEGAPPNVCRLLAGWVREWMSRRRRRSPVWICVVSGLVCPGCCPMMRPSASARSPEAGRPPEVLINDGLRRMEKLRRAVVRLRLWSAISGNQDLGDQSRPRDSGDAGRTGSRRAWPEAANRQLSQNPEPRMFRLYAPQLAAKGWRLIKTG